MTKVTSKLQVTVPKVIADRYGIRPGDEIEWVAAGETIRIIHQGRHAPSADLPLRLRLFDAATRRQQKRQAARGVRAPVRGGRGWTREELYDRARAR